MTGHTEAIGAVAVVDDVLLTASQDRCIKKWSVSSEATAEFTIKAHEKDINHVAMSPDASLFISCSQDKTAKVIYA